MFTELIHAQRNRQDAESLEMIREYYMEEVRQGRGEIEREASRRREAERMVERMGEEIRRL